MIAFTLFGAPEWVSALIVLLIVLVIVNQIRRL